MKSKEKLYHIRTTCTYRNQKDAIKNSIIIILNDNDYVENDSDNVETNRLNDSDKEESDKQHIKKTIRVSSVSDSSLYCKAES